MIGIDKVDGEAKKNHSVSEGLMIKTFHSLLPREDLVGESVLKIELKKSIL
jgi:hypothetical protein